MSRCEALLKHLDEADVQSAPSKGGNLHSIEVAPVESRGLSRVLVHLISA